jgi:hypothetical protein
MRDGEALLVVYEAVEDKGAQVSGSRGGRKRKKTSPHAPHFYY